MKNNVYNAQRKDDKSEQLLWFWGLKHTWKNLERNA